MGVNVWAQSSHMISHIKCAIPRVGDSFYSISHSKCTIPRVGDSFFSIELAIIPLKEDNLSTKVKTAGPKGVLIN